MPAMPPTTTPLLVALLSASLCTLTAADTFVLFEDDPAALVEQQDRGFEGALALDTADPYSGAASARVTPYQAFIAGYALPIRERPGPGEFRYLSLAMRQRGGHHLVVHFGGGPKNVINNTHCGMPVWWPSVELLRDVPEDWRAFEGDEALDIWKMFGDFDLCYVSFAPLDGECAWFDHVALTATLQEARALLDPQALRRSLAAPLEARLARLATEAQTLRAECPPATRVQSVLAEAREELRRASASLDKAAGPGDAATYAAHRHLNQCRRLLDGPVARRFSDWRPASAGAAEADPVFGVGITSTAQRIFEDDPFPERAAGSADLALARNEYEGVQVVVQAFDRPVDEVKVEATVPDAPEGLTLEVSRLGCIATKPSVAPITPAGKTRWPDPLLPNDPVLIPADESRMWFVTAHATENCPPGEYQGSILVRAANGRARTVPLTLSVWDISLPRESTLKTAFSLSECAIEGFYGMDKAMPQDLRRQYYRFCLAHRLNPSNLYGSNDGSFSLRHGGAEPKDIHIERIVTPRDEDLEYCAGLGMNLFNVSYGCSNWMDTETFLGRLRDFTARYSENLRERGLLDRAYIYCFDEPRPQTEEDYAGMKRMLRLVHEAAPSLKRAATHPPDPKLYDCIDIWIPLISQWDEKVAAERTAAGDEVWWYVCNVPNHPFPNFAIVEAPFVDGRVLPWLAWKYQVPGLLYHNLNWWLSQVGFDAMAAFSDAGPRMWTPVPESLRWPRVPWDSQCTPGYNGDGMLIYPGPGGKPLSSARLENVRDGLEDHELICLLRERIEAEHRQGRQVPETLAQLLQVPPEVARDLQHYSEDASALLAHRREIAEAILSLSGS